MLYREIKAVCSEIHTKHINTLCAKNVELLDVKPRVTYSDHWALKFYSVAEHQQAAIHICSCIAVTP